ncbi:MAG: glycosyltransferase family 1 protein, partial [Erythrobacter sp.]
MMSPPKGIRTLPDFPPLQGAFGPRRLARIAQAMQPYDLAIGYGWPAIDVAMAHTLFRDAMGLPPMVHYESG